MEEYLEKMRKHFVDVIEELKSTRFLWKIYLILRLYFEYYKSDRNIEKEMFIHSFHQKFMLSSSTDVLINEIFQSIKDKYEDLDKQMKGSIFSFRC